MNNAVGSLILLVAGGAVIVISVCHPAALSDVNSFLKQFVNHEFLNIIGIIVAITTASAANVHLELRRLEAMYKFKDGFERTRNEVKRGAFALIVLFGSGVVLVVIKPLLPQNEHMMALINGAALLIILWNILVLWALVGLAFKVGPIDLDE
jgi:hypothetical protein